MNRKEELLKIIGENDTICSELVEEVVFLEEQLKELKKLPFIKVNPKNKMQQKSTPASKQYKEFLQQYNNSLKTLFRITGQSETEEESPLRLWAKQRQC